MNDHDATVTAVLAEVPTMTGTYLLGEDDAAEVLDALTEAGYAVVRLPEGMKVAHGTRLEHRNWSSVGPLFTIEDTP